MNSQSLHTKQDASQGRINLIYSRVSTPHQAEEGASLDTQEKELRALAKTTAPDLRVVVLREEGKSARSGKVRPKYEEAKRLIEDGLVANIFATKTDRLGRSVVEYLTFLGLCHDNGTAVHTKNGKVEDTATGKLLAGILGVIAEFETDLRSERVREVNEHLAENGYWAGGNPPWGLKRGRDRILYPAADLSLICEAFERYDAGASMRRVHRFLVGAAKQERQTISLDFVSKMLRNHTYTGFVPSDTKSPAPIYHEGRHGPTFGVDPPVPRELFERVQVRLRANKETGYRGQTLSPFGAIARCGSCGATLRTHRLSEKEGGYAYLVCSARCGKVSPIPVEQLELWVVAYAGVIPQWIEQALVDGGWRDVIPNAAEREQVEAELEQADRARAEIRTALRNGLLTADEAASDLESTARTQDRLRPRHERLSADAEGIKADLERLRDHIDHGFPNGMNLAQFWQGASGDEKRQAAAAILERIELGNNKIGLAFRYGLRTPLPILLDIDRVRRTPELTAKYRELNFGLESADRAKAPEAAESPQPRAAPRIAAQTEPGRKSRQLARARWSGRSPIPPSSTRQAQG
jgi:DNA invertase Pin-like site-specific DNA recombinase